MVENRKPAPENGERKQSPEEREKLDGLWECVLCFSCSTACPSHIGGIVTNILVRLFACRPIAGLPDSRDDYKVNGLMRWMTRFAFIGAIPS